MTVITPAVTDLLSETFRELTAYIVDANGRTVSEPAPASIVWKGSMYHVEIPAIYVRQPATFPVELRLYKAGAGMVFSQRVSGATPPADWMTFRVQMTERGC